MKVTQKAVKLFTTYQKNPKEFYIRYKGNFSEGIIIVDTKYYNDNIKRFDKVLKDVVILEFTERDKK